MGGIGSAAVAYMGNMSMNPLNAPLILILRTGCDVKPGVIKKRVFFRVGKHFMGSSIVEVRCEPIILGNLFLKVMGNVSDMLFKAVDVLHCPEKYLSFCLESL